MSKYPENWLKNCAITRIPDPQEDDRRAPLYVHKIHLTGLLLAVIVSLFVNACGGTKIPPASPGLDLVNPEDGTEMKTHSSFQKAYQKYLRGDHVKARSGFSDLIEEDPGYYPAYLAYGYTYLAENKPDSAERYARKAIELKPEYPQAHFALAHILESRSDYQGALQELEQVAALNPDYPALEHAGNVLKLKATEQYLNYGRRLAESNPVEALKYLKAAHNLAPEVAQIPVEIADILLKQNNCQDAVNYLRIALEKMPDDREVQTKLAECLVRLKEYTQALRLYETLSLQDSAYRQRIIDVKKLIFISNLPSAYQNIPYTAEITRSQLAAYLAINLEFLQQFRSENQEIIVDIIKHWAQNYIQTVVNLGIMDVFPNRTFQPDLPISKLEMAKAASRILEIIELSGRREFPAETTVNISDIPPNNIYFGMVVRPLAAGVITVDADGKFHAHRKVTGAEAMSVANRIKDLVE